jgi:hypothetical protein
LVGVFFAAGDVQSFAAGLSHQGMIHTCIVKSQSSILVSHVGSQPFPLLTTGKPDSAIVVT